MKLRLSDYSINFKHIKNETLIEKWIWLIGADKTPVLITSLGDLFFRDNEENIYWLMVGVGEVEKVSNSLKEFEEKLNNEDLFDEWFLPILVKEIKEEGLELIKNSLYSYKLIPILGGKYDVQNYEVTDIEVHFNTFGQIQKEIKDLPDGTTIRLADFE